MDKKNIEIGKRIKELRKEKNFSQTRLGERIRRDHSTISEIERGNIELTPFMRLAICNIFAVNERWLMTGRGPKYDETIVEMEKSIKGLGEKAFIKYLTMKAAYTLRKESTRAVMDDKAHYGSYDELADPELYDILNKVAKLCEDKDKKDALRKLIDVLVGEKQGGLK